MASSSNSNNVHHIRSISLPSGSHHSTHQIEEELNNVKIWEASTMSTAEKISNGLTGLEKLYPCVEELLSSPMTHQALSHPRNEKWVNELLDLSMRLVEVCGSTRDVMLLVKEQGRDLQSALRRRKGDSCLENIITRYTSFKRRSKKDVKGLIAALKQIESQIRVSSLVELNHQLLRVIRVLREVSIVTISILRSLLLFLCVHISKPKASGRSMVSKLIHTGATKSDLYQISVELETVERHTEATEYGLESIFRSLIKTRASLLNIMSQ